MLGWVWLYRLWWHLSMELQQWKWLSWHNLSTSPHLYRLYWDWKGLDWLHSHIDWRMGWEYWYVVSLSRSLEDPFYHCIWDFSIIRIRKSSWRNVLVSNRNWIKIHTHSWRIFRWKKPSLASSLHFLHWGMLDNKLQLCRLLWLRRMWRQWHYPGDYAELQW